MGVTTNSLFLRLKELEGITPWDFILYSRLNYAKALISEGKSDLYEVSRQAGFPNKDAFFSAYKKLFGYMPGTIFEKK
jgi:transcriptional regulator GlxA family with amidase domain